MSNYFILLFNQEAASEKGILEQSEITLVSLTDTTLQDQETTITDEEEIWEDKLPDGVRDEGPKSQETEVTSSDPNPLTNVSTCCLSNL